MGHVEVIHVFLGAQHTHIHGAPSQFAPLTALSEEMSSDSLRLHPRAWFFLNRFCRKHGKTNIYIYVSRIPLNYIVEPTFYFKASGFLSHGVIETCFSTNGLCSKWCHCQDVDQHLEQVAGWYDSEVSQGIRNRRGSTKPSKTRVVDMELSGGKNQMYDVETCWELFSRIVMGDFGLFHVSASIFEWHHLNLSDGTQCGLHIWRYGLVIRD